MRWLAAFTDSVDMSLSKLRKIVIEKPGMLQFMGLQRLEEAQTGIKIAGRNINNLRCANDTPKEPLDESERGARKELA